MVVAWAAGRSPPETTGAPVLEVPGGEAHLMPGGGGRGELSFPRVAEGNDTGAEYVTPERDVAGTEADEDDRGEPEVRGHVIKDRVFGEMGAARLPPE